MTLSEGDIDLVPDRLDLFGKQSEDRTAHFHSRGPGPDKGSFESGPPRFIQLQGLLYDRAPERDAPLLNDYWNWAYVRSEGSTTDHDPVSVKDSALDLAGGSVILNEDEGPSDCPGVVVWAKRGYRFEYVEERGEGHRMAHYV